LQTVVKKWFRDKNYGFLDNGKGPDIMVRKGDLSNCQYLKVGASVEFECHPDKNGLVAKNVKLTKANNQSRQNQNRQGNSRNNGYQEQEFRPGVMT
jgi:cold shock CspA family protein